MKKFFFLLMLFVALHPVACYGKAASIFQSLKIPGSARLTSLGGVNSFNPVDASSVWQNPSSAVFVPSKEVSIGGFDYLGGILSSLNFAAVFPIDKRKNAFGLTFSFVGSEHVKIDAPPADNNYAYIETNKFSSYDMVCGGFYSVMVQPSSSFGIALKFITEKLYSETYLGAAMDISLTEIVDRQSAFCIGARNVGAAARSSYLPPMSAYVTIFKKIGVVNFAIEGEQDIFNAGEVKTGFEIPIADVLFVRAGFHHPFSEYDTGDFILSRLTAGFGIAVNKLKIDYAYYPKGDLGISHFLSIGIKL